MISASRRDLFRVVSFSGGGYKGVFSLRIVEELEHSILGLDTGDLARHGRIQDCTDAFVGTSVGAIIAAGLAIGKSPDELLKIFFENGEKIFPGESGPGYFRSRYWKGKRNLDEILQKTFGDRRFRDLEVPCYVSAVDVETGNTLLVGGFNGSQLHFEDCLIWEAVSASVSAPTYFPFKRYEFTKGDRENSGSSGWLVDGGLSSNAPELLACADLSKNFGVKVENFFILSIGTTESTISLFSSKAGIQGVQKKVGILRQIRDKIKEYYLSYLCRDDMLNWGALAWFINGKVNLIELILRSQVNVSIRICQTLVPDCQFIRLDALLPEGEQIDIDDPMQYENLCEKARVASEYVLSRENPGAYKLGLFLNLRRTGEILSQEAP